MQPLLPSNKESRNVYCSRFYPNSVPFISKFYPNYMTSCRIGYSKSNLPDKPDINQTEKLPIKIREEDYQC